MILLNGCSFSTNAGLNFPPYNDKPFLKKHIWPNLLSEKLNEPIINLAEQGKSNSLIFRQLYTYLIWAAEKKVEMPTSVIMQIVDFKRDHAFLHSRSGKLKPNDLETQLTLDNYIKIYSASYENYLREQKQSPWKTPVTTYVTYDIREELDHPVRREHGIGDISTREVQLRNLLEIHALQTLCKKLKIEFALLNFWAFYENTKKDPLYEILDKSKFVLENQNTNFYHYMVGSDFTMPDRSHFGLDGHKFISDIVYNFISNKVKFNFPDDVANGRRRIRATKVFDYTEK
jgi:hypothetical protein